MKEFVYKDKQRGQKRKKPDDKTEEGWREPQERRDDRDPPKRGVIHIIIGGPIEGDSNRARRASVRALKELRQEK